MFFGRISNRRSAAPAPPAGGAKPPLTGAPLHERVTRAEQRLRIVKASLLVCFAVVAARLVHVQVIQSPYYREVARKQYEAPSKILAERGIIFDRNARILVSNSMLTSFAADPESTRAHADPIAENFARVFGNAKPLYLTKLTRDDRRFVWLERKARPDQTDRILAHRLPGIIAWKEPDRVYHYDHVAAQLLGFTDIDSVALAGIEQQFDEQLKGSPGSIVLQRDGKRRSFATVDYPRIEPVNGNNLVLTLDLDYQSIAEDELRKGVERTKAEGGLVVMLEPATGAVLAMANYPGFNPNHVKPVDTLFLRNRVITDVFEPGSVFKIVTASAALEHNLVRPDEKFFAEKGSYVRILPGGKKWMITDAHPHGMLTFQQAMEQSSNIVMAKISDRVGAERLYTTARNFGFGIPSGIELPAERSGNLPKPVTWSLTTLNTMAYGYEVAVTPLQIAAAYAAVANNGVLMKPYLVRQILNSQNEIISETRPQKIRQVISRATADTLRKFLVGVVERGTATVARLEGVNVAGKTGTSKQHGEGGYISGSYTASFVGFFPVEDPRVVCLVMLDNPRLGGYYGGQASAPIFKEIAQKVVATSQHFTKKTQTVFAGKELIAVPDVSALAVNEAESTLKSFGFNLEVRGEGKVVLRQFPLSGTKLTPGERIIVMTTGSTATLEQGLTTVPDVRGLSMRRALNRLTIARLDAAIQGSGTVVAQSPSAGEQVKPATRVVIRCQPKSFMMVSLQ